METKYSDDAVNRSRTGAIDWLSGREDGYPRSWQQEEADEKRRGYIAYEHDWEAPPIAGYEALEREGLVTRMEIVMKDDQERIHFRLTGDLPPAE